MVDGDPIHRKILSEQIDGLVAATSAVISPEFALDTLRQGAADNQPFSACLLSINSPATAPLVAAISADPALANIKLIAVLALSEAPDLEAISAAGFHPAIYR